MGKTDLTLSLEKLLWDHTRKTGTFGCFEVTIGFWGKERVDYLTYDTKGEWRFYEIKISKADFYSKSHNTFLGNFNYYVMPRELFDEIKHEIPDHVGVFVSDGIIDKRSYLVSAKKAKRQLLKADEKVLKDSLIRSLCRDARKYSDNKDESKIDSLARRMREAERKKKRYYDECWALRRWIQEHNPGVRVILD